MLKSFDFKNRFTISLIIIVLSFLSLIGPLSFHNIIFWFVLCLINFGLKVLKFKYKNFLNILLIGFSIYIQFVFDFETLTKEFFVHLLGILMIFKFFELRQERDYYFYVNLSFFISVISLLDGQDIISCLCSLLIMLFGIYLLYIINQIKFPEFKFKNLLKILGFVFALVPFVIATYLIFPRTNININLLGQTQNKIGIPESISLGSFNSITNTRDKVFDVNFNNNQFNQKEFYFRVKVFDVLNENNTWISMSGNISNSRETKYKNIQPDIKYELIMSPHDKKWLPAMDYIYEIQAGYNIHPTNFTVSSNLNLQKAKKFQMKSAKVNYVQSLSQKQREIYTNISADKFPRLNKWATDNKKNDAEEYLNKVLKKIKDEEYFYTLTPKIVGNDYDAFFFDTKEGYCEHYAGAFVILSRLANIPARIVTGYYGGEYNKVGDFYSFRQSDAHSWTEVFINGKGWVRYDPTNIIPLSRVDQNNNLFIDNQIYLEKENKNELNFSNKFNNQLNKIFQYFTFIDYRWTNFFLSYNQVKQRELYNSFKNLNKESLKNYSFITMSLILVIVLYLICFLIFKKINNPNFIIHEILKILKKRKIHIQLNNEIEYIFVQFETLTKNVSVSTLRRIYINEKFKNEKINFVEKVKLYFQLKKIALTN